MRRMLLPLVLLAIVAPATGRAQVKVSVFDLEGSQGAVKAAARITRALRRQVGAKSNLAVVPGKSLAEIKLVFGCPDRPISAFHKCLAKVGRNLKADRILLGRVRYRRGAYKVALTLLDVSRPLRPSTVSARLPASETRSTALARHAASWLASLLGLRQPAGKLGVLCSVQGVQVLVDGRPAGTCGEVEQMLSLSPGTHEVTFTKDGFVTATRTVSISSGQTSRLSIKLRAKAVGLRPEPPGREGTTPPPRAKANTRLTWKILFYTTVGVGAALLVSSIFTGMQVDDLEREKESIIRASFTEAPSQWITEQDDVCAHHPSGYDNLDRVCKRGKRFAAATNALIGVGAVLVAGSGYFLYRAYFARDSKEQPSTAARPQPARFAVTPQLWERGGGVSATLRF